MRLSLIYVCLGLLLAGGGFAQTPAAELDRSGNDVTDRQALIDHHKAKSPIAGVPPEEFRAAMHAYFGTPAGLKAPRPEPEVVSKTDAGDHERWKLRYAVEEDEFGHAYLLLPKPLPTLDRKLPAVICPHPTSDIGKDRVAGVYAEAAGTVEEAADRAGRQYALDLVRRGFITFAPDRAAYGERRLMKEGNYQVQMAEFRKYLNNRHPGWKLTSGKNVWDLQRGMDVLQTFDFVAGDRIGVIGHSLGAWDSIMFMAMDDRIKAGVVNSGGMPSFKPELWEDPDKLRAYLGNPKGQGLTSNTNIFIMLAAPRPLFYLHSLQDAYERGLPNLIEGVRSFTQYYRSISDERKLPGKADFSLFLHGYGHDFPPEAREAAYKFLASRLGFQK